VLKLKKNNSGAKRLIIRGVRNIQCYVHVADEFTSLNKAK